MLKKILSLHYSNTNVEGKFDFGVHPDQVIVEITSSKLQYHQVLNIRLKFSENMFALERKLDKSSFKIEMLNEDDETVFSFIDLKNDPAKGWSVDIENFCNLSALIFQNPNVIIRASKDSMMSTPHIKMVLTIGTKDELLPLSSLTNINSLSPIQMLRSILNDTAFDDRKIEAGAIGTLIETCVDRLRNVIDVQNAANILRLAQKYNIESLKKDTAKFVADNFQQVMETSGWKEMPDHLSKELFSIVLLSLRT